MPYTETQVAALTAAEPVTYEEAVAFGEEFGKSTQSVISKVKSLELEYIKKAVPAPKPPQATKAEILASIEARANIPLPGLIGATRDALVALDNAFEEAYPNG